MARTIRDKIHEPDFKQAVMLCRWGITPLALETGLAHGTLAELAATMKITENRAAGLCVYYGLLTESEALGALIESSDE